MDSYERIPRALIADTQIFNHDSRRSVADYFRDQGVNFSPAWKSDEAGSRAMLNDRFISNKILIDPECKNAITQLMNYVWKSGNGSAETPIDKDDEAPDCLRYFCAHVKKQDRPTSIEETRKKERYGKRNYSVLSQEKERKGWQAL